MWLSKSYNYVVMYINKIKKILLIGSNKISFYIWYSLDMVFELCKYKY